VIGGSIEGNYSSTDEVDFRKIDRILDVTETGMLAVASEHKLREPKIERWRWDKPEILMSWAPSRQFPSVGKNIRVVVKPERTDLFHLYFESNAWYDERWNPDSFTRYWDHFSVGTIPIADPKRTLEPEVQRIRDYLEKAYEKVSDSSRIRLDHAISISSNGETFSLEEKALISNDSVELIGRRFTSEHQSERRHGDR
jgi:hypothetical protein